MKLILKLLAGCLAALAPAAATPEIGAILNAASYARPGLPNSGIAPGSVFVVFGTELGPADLRQAAGFPLPLTLAGTSIRVTVGNTSVDAILLYTSALQVAAILPSNTPTGVGSMAVTYQGQTSQSATFRIQRNAPGILTQNQSGFGVALAQNFNSEADQPRNSPTHAAHPGQVVTLWGTGLGPIAGSDAVVPTPQDLALNLQVMAGGKAAEVRYQGRSGCCAGVDQVIFEIPAGVEGCTVPVTVRVDDAVSNFATLAVAATGDVCTDLNGISGADIEKLQGNGTISFGAASLAVTQDCGDLLCDATLPLTYDEVASGYFAHAGQPFLGSSVRLGLPVPGSCLLYPAGATFAVIVLPPVPLDAGSQLNLTGPKGSVSITATSTGQYYQQLSSLAPRLQFLEPGDYVLDNGPGGSAVGPFRATLTIPQPFTATVQQPPGAVRVSWSGGSPAGYVVIQGMGEPTAGGANTAFVCTERVAAGQFSLPAEVILSLPAQTGNRLPVSVSAPVTTIFRATGLEIGQFSFAAPVQ